MNQNFKTYIKLGVLLFGITVLITACQKEKLNDLETPKNTLESYKVTSLEKLTELQPTIENVKRITPKTSGLARNFNDFVPLENIDADKVIQYTDSTGYSTYTFKIIGDENSINFENFHLLETEEGFIGYILSYEPNEDWYNSHLIYQHGEYILEMNDYEGELTKYSLTREVIWSTIEQDNDDSSTSRAGQFIIECTVSMHPCVCAINTNKLI